MLKSTLITGLLYITCLTVKAQLPGATIDVLHYNFNITLSDANDVIKGKADIEAQFLKNSTSVSFDLVKTKADGKGMLISAVTENGAKLNFIQDTDKVVIYKNAASGSKHVFAINYSGIPADGLIISTNKFNHRTFFGDNWPNRAHNWLPCVDYPADKAAVDFIVTAPDHYKVVANGLLLEEKVLPDHLKLSHWKETAPLPTKVMVIGVAEFAVEQSGDVKNIPVYTYVFPENREAGFKSYHVAPEILDYYINKVGPYAYKKLANVQSKTIFGGMENAGAIFYFENSVTSKGVEELMAHEIAHQWFGDAASEKNFHHLWLSEGFATFMTNVYLENKYGPDTMRKRLAKDRIMVLNFEQKRLTPVVDTAVNNSYMQLLNANSYQKGGWILAMLREKLGETSFWKGIRAYYAKYENGNANSDDLRRELEQASGLDLKIFFKQWLYTAGAPHLEIRWKYDDDKKVLKLHIAQMQENLLSFPLEIALDGTGNIRQVAINNKVTDVEFAVPTKPQTILVDPKTKLLAEFKIID